MRDGLPDGAELEITVKNTARPALTPTDAPAITLAGDAFEHVVGARPFLVRTGGTLPIYAGLVARGLPTLATGFGIESECNVHAPNENVPEDALELGVATLREVFTRLESLAARAPFSSPLAEELAGDVLERFLRYVRVDTQGAYRVRERPSTQKQLDLSRLLVEELREIGLEDAELNDGHSVFATLPGTSIAPVVGLIAHVDTTPDVSGAGVDADRARGVGRRADRAARRSSQVLDPGGAPALAARVGHDIVTSDGRRSSAPTTRRGSPRSWRRSPTSPELPSGRARRSASRSPSTRRSGAAPRTSTSRLRRGRRVHARRLRSRRARGRDLLGGLRQGHDPRALRASRNGEGQARERGEARIRARVVGTADRLSPETTEERGGLRASASHLGLDRGGGGRLHRARPRRRAAR